MFPKIFHYPMFCPCPYCPFVLSGRPPDHDDVDVDVVSTKMRHPLLLLLLPLDVGGGVVPASQNIQTSTPSDIYSMSYACVSLRKSSNCKSEVLKVTHFFTV